MTISSLRCLARDHRLRLAIEILVEERVLVEVEEEIEIVEAIEGEAMIAVEGEVTLLLRAVRATEAEAVITASTGITKADLIEPTGRANEGVVEVVVVGRSGAGVAQRTRTSRIVLVGRIYLRRSSVR